MPRTGAVDTEAGWRRLIKEGCAAALCFAAVIGVPPLARGQEQSSTGKVLPIDAANCNDMKAHHVIGPHPPVGCDRLSLVKFSFVDFNGRLHSDGQIVVIDAAAKHVLDIFEALLRRRFQIAKAQLIQHYDGDDEASMRDNNTSAFNDREITGGGPPSLHAYGLAIDINPIQNPYVTRNGATYLFDPPAGADYVNRLDDRPWKAERPGMAESVVDIFAENGFVIWGGYWDTPIDYQHFQVGRKLAERLAQLSPGDAAAAFDDLVKRYRSCRSPPTVKGDDRTSCVEKADPDGN